MECVQFPSPTSSLLRRSQLYPYVYYKKDIDCYQSVCVREHDHPLSLYTDNSIALNQTGLIDIGP